jgi:hypothetical protein
MAWNGLKRAKKGENLGGSASQAEGRGFESRFPLQEIQGLSHHRLSPFLLLLTVCIRFCIRLAVCCYPAPYQHSPKRVVIIPLDNLSALRGPLKFYEPLTV